MNDIKPADKTLAMTADNYAALAANPLMAVPPPLRPQVFRAWTLYRHLTGMETAGPIAFAVAVWIEDHGVKPEKVAKSLARLMSPKVMREIKFASDLTAALADMCSPSDRNYDYIPGVSCDAD